MTRVSAPLGDLCIVGGTVVDPRDGSAVTNVSVLIKNGRIVALENNAGAYKSASDVQRIDATGKFVVRGYNDMHTHVLERQPLRRTRVDAR